MNHGGCLYTMHGDENDMCESERVVMFTLWMSENKSSHIDSSAPETSNRWRHSQITDKTSVDRISRTSFVTKDEQH